LPSSAEQGFELGLFAAQLGQLALDLDAFEARELAQADLEDVLGLAVERSKRAISAGLGSSDSRMMRITSSMFRKTM
jgi:hypothetical protein